MINTFDIIPIKSSDIEILPFDGDGHLIVHKKLKYHLNVNQSIIDLLSLIDGKQSILQIATAYSNNFRKEVSVEKIHEILYNDLGKYHIIENAKYESIPLGKPEYLKLSFTVLKKKWVRPITRIMSPLFSNNVFYPLLVVSLLLIAIIGVVNYSFIYDGIINRTITINIPFTAVITILTVFMHELGHATACHYYGSDHGEIGFGIYLLTPVMYADVSNIWKLKKKERIVVNLGGLYVQILIALIFGILFLITKHFDFLALMYMLGGISVIVNLNPFFRTDGYWILSDIVGINNLRQYSNKKAFDFFKWISRKGDFIFNKKNHYCPLKTN